jgi:hypothetical protein
MSDGVEWRWVLPAAKGRARPRPPPPRGRRPARSAWHGTGRLGSERGEAPPSPFCRIKHRLNMHVMTFIALYTLHYFHAGPHASPDCIPPDATSFFFWQEPFIGPLEPHAHCGSNKPWFDFCRSNSLSSDVGPHHYDCHVST